MWPLCIALILCASRAWTANYFINEVMQELKPSLLIIQQDYCPMSWLQQLLVEPQLPVMLQSQSSLTTSRQHFTNVLHIICLPGMDLPPEQLTTLLPKRREGKIIFNIGTTATNSTNQQVLQSLLRQCYSWRILHVIALLAEDGERFYYRYRAYPHFELEQRTLQRRPFFLESFPNMQRQPLIVLPDQNHPRTIIYTDWRTGAQVLGGSVGHFVHTLAWKLNATLQFPKQLKPGQSLHSNQLLGLAEELNVDVPAGLMRILEPEQLAKTSYPFELSHLCLMIPIAQSIPIRDIYLILGSAQHILIALAIIYSFGLLLSLNRRLTGLSTALVDFVLNDVALRGVLGQSFRQSLQTSICSSLIYLMLGLLGLNLSTIHEAALGTLLTHPPKYFQPRSFADVQRAELPLVVNIADVITNTDIEPLPLRLLTVNVSELNRQRDNMNMSHVYFASRLKWTLLSAQQKYFPNEVFLYSMDACISTLTIGSFQLPNNSWFMEPINKLIMDVRANGLFQRWVGMHFYDMAAAGLISFSDPIKRPSLRIGGSLEVKDLLWIWFAYIALLLIALIVFVFEIIIYKMQRLQSKP